MALPMIALPIIALSTRVKLSIQLKELIKVFKQKRSQSATNGANKKAKEPKLFYIDYQPGKQESLGCTKLATLFAVCIELMRFALAVVYTKPTRLLLLSK